MNLAEVLSHFPNVKAKGRSQTRFECCCPAHDDKHPSCSLYINDDWVNVHCFTGCSEDEILKAVGLTKKDLFIGTKEVKMQAIKTAYKYYDFEGTHTYTRERVDNPDKTKKFYFKKPDGSYGIGDIKHLLYNLPAVLSAETIYFVEGEKCADIINSQGYVATTMDSGANSVWYPEYAEWLKGKQVIIIPDNDKPGMMYAENIKSHIPWAVIKILPDLKEKEDIYDWLQAGHTMSEIDKLPDKILENSSSKITNPTDTPIDNTPQSEIMLSLVRKENIEAFLNENNDVFVVIPINNHKETLSIDSHDFSLWLQQLFYKANHKTIRNESLKQAISILSAEVLFGEKDYITLYNRVGKHQNEFWYDLTNPEWEAVKISKSGWSVTNETSKIFCRYRHQKEQVTPQPNGDIKNIFEYINMSKYKTLFLCWLVSCFVPDIPHPMPIFYGEKGAAKSTTCTLLKRLIDPSALETLQLSKDERTLIINLQQHYFLPFDNVSTISNDVSDILCRAITGSAVQQRKLFTNGEDYIFTFKRCLSVNGINNVANRADLLDRSIMFELERVSEENRKELGKVYESFEQARPELLGAIFNILSKAMEIYPNVMLDKLPRMADFCRWGYAIAEAIDGHGETFLKEYSDNQGIQNTEAINADSVAFLIVELMRNSLEWKGRISELLVNLQELAQNHGIQSNSKSLPNAPNALSRRIKSVKSNLETVGIEYRIEDNHSDGTHIVLINKNLSPLPSYYVVPQVNRDIPNGDSSDDVKITMELSPCEHHHDSQVHGDDEENGDNYTDVEF